ncbi:MAG TPA: VCBS repeat-containing protein [Verrucomicrobiae bacterium]
MKHLFFLSSGAVLFVSVWSGLGAEFPAFAVHTIDRFGKNIGQTALVDVDRDGDLDWVAGNASYAGGEIHWWEFQSADKWVRHPIGKGNTDVGGAAFDVNGDGWVDFVAGSVLLLNSREPKTKAFQAFEIGTIHSHDTEFADVNGDGRMDLIANTDKTGLFWYEIPANPTNKWIEQKIASATEHKVHGGVSPRAVADLDSDGDHDVVTAEGWYENVGKAREWKFRKQESFLGESHQFGVSVRSWVCDMDRDKDIDVVQAENDNPDGRIAWFENDGKGKFKRHPIRDEGRGEDFHSLAVADFDGDGDLDVYSGAGPISASKKFACYIWENTRSSWIEHQIADKHCHEAEAADVDGDGDIDICSKPWSGTDEHFFLRNMMMEKKSAERH